MSNRTKAGPSLKDFTAPLPRGEHGGVQLLLIQTVDHLGKQGDVVEVKAGYANNYLLPQGLATLATEHHRRMVEKHKAELLERERQRLATYRQLADALARHSVTIDANANDEGHLYGSVGAPEISAALRATEFNILPEQVRLEGPLKELGLYTVKIHLHQDIEAELKVWVVPTATSDEQAAKPESKSEGKAEPKAEKSEKAAKGDKTEKPAK